MNIVTIFLIVNVFTAIGIIALVLMQQSKGDMGSAFGGGGSQSMFGSRGSSNFLSRSTAIMCTVFFLSSLGLAYTYAKRSETSIVETSVIEQVSEIPSIDVPQTDADVVPDVEIPVISGASDEAPLQELEAQVKDVIEQK